MTEPFPIPRQLRQSDPFDGNGGATYAGFGFKIFDVADVEVWAKAATEIVFTKRAVTVVKLNNLPLDDFSVTFSAGQPSTTAIVVRSARLAERTAGVDNGTRLSMNALEKELSKQATVQQEVRRDLDRAVTSDFGEAGLIVEAGIGDGITLMKQGDRLVAGPDIVTIGAAAEAAKDIAAGYASDAVSQGNVPIYGTIAGMPAITIPAGINAIRVNGHSAAGDGYGGFFTDADTGGPVVFTSGGATGRPWYKGYPEPMSDDATSVPGDPRKFWESSYFGNPAEGKVGRLNRLLVGVAALSGGDRPANPSTWVDQYFEVIADAQLAVVSALGSLAVVGVSRASDYRTFIGASAGGAQGVSGFAVNDDTIGPAVAAGVYGEAIHLPGVPGITEAAEFTISNGGSVVDITPVGGITSGTTFAINLSAGFRADYGHNVSAYMVFGSNTGHGVVARKGIVSLDGLDHSVGTGGRGVAFELLRQQSIRILDETNATDAEMFSDASGLHIKSKSVLVDDLTLNNVPLSNGWTQFTSLIQASSGALGTSSATIFYKKIGSTIVFRGTATITLNGSGSGSLAIFLPSYAQGDSYATGRASGVSGQIQGVISAADNRIVLLDKNDGYLGADGRTLSFSGQYEVHP